VISECSYSDDSSHADCSPKAASNSTDCDGSKMKNVKVMAKHVRSDKLCAVCGDKALGCNFDAVSCESCKAFFRRNAFKDSVRMSFLLYACNELQVKFLYFFLYSFMQILFFN